jgi:hypothetical protein
LGSNTWWDHVLADHEGHEIRILPPTAATAHDGDEDAMPPGPAVGFCDTCERVVEPPPDPSETRLATLTGLVNDYLDVDGSRGEYRAMRLHEAREALEAALATTLPGGTVWGFISNETGEFIGVTEDGMRKRWGGHGSRS